MESAQLVAWKTRPAKTAPRKVLPTSPIKTLAGLQFHKRKPNRDPQSVHMDQGKCKMNDRTAMATSMQPARRPSSPSMKLIKLIKEITTTTRKKIKGTKYKLPAKIEEKID